MTMFHKAAVADHMSVKTIDGEVICSTGNGPASREEKVARAQYIATLWTLVAKKQKAPQ